MPHATLISHIGNFDIINANDVFFGTSSLYWSTGVSNIILGTINGATRIITSEPISPEMLMRIIEKHKVTVTFFQSFNIIEILKRNLISKANLSSLRHVFIGGWKLPLSIVAEFNSYLPNGCVNVGYGMTEIGSWITIDYPKFSGKNSVGRLLNRYAVKIIDEQGNRCGIDTDGEICIKARYTFLGYGGNKQLSEESFDSEGFFLTGDLGHIDKDGYLYLIGRKKDIIPYTIIVLPDEIEEFLIISPDIKAVCVVGVPFNQSIEVPAAVVVRENNSKITEDNICKIVTGILRFYEYYFVTISKLDWRLNGVVIFKFHFQIIFPNIVNSEAASTSLNPFLRLHQANFFEGLRN